MKDYSKIKLTLLKSGLPLESMVAEAINSMSSKFPHPLLNHGEYFFKRQEAQLPHSIDFQVTHDLDIKDCDFIQVVFLIECKYCTKGTGWYFSSSPLKDAGMEFFVENFFSKGKCNRKTFPSLIPPLNDKAIPIAGKGIEIYSNGQRNEKTITEGIHQLMFACCDSLSRAFFREEDMQKAMEDRGIDIKGRSFHSLLCPVIVTTSDLLFLKNPSIEKVEQSERLEDISDVKEIITYSTPKPPLYVRRYITGTVAEDIKSLLYSISEAEKTRAEIYLLNYSLLNPSRYYIVNYREFEAFLEDYISLATSMLYHACNKSDS